MMNGSKPRRAHRRHLVPRFSPTATWDDSPPDPFGDIFGKPIPTKGHGRPIVTITDVVVVPPTATPDPLPPINDPTTTTSSTPTVARTTPTTTSSTSTTSSTTSTSSTSSPTETLPTPQVTFTPDFATPSTTTSASPTPTQAASVPTTSSAPAPQSSLNTGSVIGGIAGAILAIAACIMLFAFVKRRMRKRDGDEFDANAFRRQSTALVDSNQSRNYGGAGGRTTPRPPSMIENRMNQVPAASYGYQQQQQGYGPQGENPFSPGGYAQNMAAPSHGPGHILVPANGAFFAGRSQSPTSSPTVPQYDSHYDASGNLIRPPSGEIPQAIAISSRHSSLDPAQQAAYVDMNRSSITPFQAVQYAEISRQLNVEIPTSASEQENRDSYLNLSDFPAVPDSRATDRSLYANQSGMQQGHSPLSLPGTGATIVPESPFADPHLQTPVAHRSSLGDAQYASFPLPAGMQGSGQRVDSNAIPEIHLQDGNREHTPSTYSAEFPVSALTNSFVLPSPTPGASFEGPVPAAIKPSPLREGTTATAAGGEVQGGAQDAKGKEKRPPTLYGEMEDAYGGI